MAEIFLFQSLSSRKSHATSSNKTPSSFFSVERHHTKRDCINCKSKERKSKLSYYLLHRHGVQHMAAMPQERLTLLSGIPNRLHTSSSSNSSISGLTAVESKQIELLLTSPSRLEKGVTMGERIVPVVVYPSGTLLIFKVNKYECWWVHRDFHRLRDFQ